MNISFTITPGVAASLCVVASMLFGALFFVGDTRWRRKTDDHKFRNDLAEKLARMQLEIADHDQLLTHGGNTMTRIDLMLQTYSETLTNIRIHLGKIDEKLQNLKEAKG